MAAITLVDFEDIYTAIIELLKIQASDTTTVSRIKRDINIAYEDVIARHKWWWNRSLTVLQTTASIKGAVALTNGSASITFASAPSVSVTNYKVKMQGRPEVYTVTAHSAGDTSATLNVPYVGATSASSSFTCWKDFLQLPTDCKETFLVQHAHRSQPMEAVGLSDFRRIVATNPDAQGTPLYYTTDDFDSTGRRRLRFWPAVNNEAINIDVDYTMNFQGLDLEGDEPIMPINDRTVLFYYGASHAWRRERNTEEANNYFQLGEKKLAEMASKLEDSKETPVLRVGNGYLAQKRQQRRGRGRF